MKAKQNQNLLFLLVATLVLVADQVTKALIRANMTLGQSIPADGRFRLSYSTNSGGIFGLSINSTVLMFMAIIVAFVITWLSFRRIRTESKILRISLGLVLGGAVGNLIDRIWIGKVTDFIDVRLWGSFHWPIFNIADASLTIGIFILACCLLIMAKDI